MRFRDYYTEVEKMGLSYSGQPVGRASHRVGRYQKDDQGYYVKYANAMEETGYLQDLQMIVEHLAFRIYGLFGLKVPSSYLVVDEEREDLGIATSEVPGKAVPWGSQIGSDIYDGWFVDVLLANWDVTGTGQDMENLLGSDEGVHRIDPGGSMTYRAQGARKGHLFGPEPGELETMRTMYPGSEAFGDMPQQAEMKASKVFLRVRWQDISQTIDQVKKEADDKIKELEDPDKRARLAQETWDELRDIHATLQERYKRIVEHIKSRF